MSNTNPTQEDIDAATKALNGISQFEENNMTQYSFWVLDNMPVILAALKQYKPVDVKGFKCIEREKPTKEGALYDAGWNDCIDHLLEQGVIRGE